MDISGPQYSQLREQILAAVHLDIEDADIDTFDVSPTVERKGYRSETSWVRPNPSYHSDPKVKVHLEVELDENVSAKFAQAVAEVRDAEFARDRELTKARVQQAHAQLILAQKAYDKALEEADPCSTPT